MQRDSSTSDWDVVGTPISQHNPVASREPLTRAPESFNSDDFFNSEGFYRVGSRSETAEGGVARRGQSNASEDGDVEPSPTRSFAPQPSPPAPGNANEVETADPSTVHTSNAANAARLPLEIQFVRGLPSSISVDSIFNAGVLTHFSPGKSKEPAYSTLSESSPSGSPAASSVPPRAEAHHAHDEIPPPPAPLRLDDDGDATSSTEKIEKRTSFRLATVAVTSDQQSTHIPSNTVPFSLPACLPRIFSAKGGPSFADDRTFPSWTSWHNPVESLVKCAVLMIFLDAVHKWSGTTWIGVAGRTMLALLSLGKAARFVYGQSAFVSSSALRERLDQVAENTRERLVDCAAEGVRVVARFVDTDAVPRSDVPPSCVVAAPTSTPGKWEKVARGVLMLGVVDAMLLHSPISGTRPLDIATFWAAFVCLRVPAAHFANYVATLERLGDCKQKNVTVSLVFQRITIPHGGGRGTVVVQPQIANVAWYVCLQALFSVCRALSK